MYVEKLNAVQIRLGECRQAVTQWIVQMDLSASLTLERIRAIINAIN